MIKKIKIKKNVKILIFDDKESYLKELVKNFYKNIKKNKINNFIFPGGTTPIPFFDRLSKEKIDWKNIKVSLTDDRIIKSKKLANRDSNYINLKKKLFDNLPQNKLPLYLPLPNKEKKYLDYIYGKFVKDSCIYLGVGIDGHIASIFNNDFNFKETKNIFFSRKIHKKYKRVSWTFNGLLKSNKIIFLLNGRQKRNLISNIINDINMPNLPYLKLIREFNNEITIMYCRKSL